MEVAGPLEMLVSIYQIIRRQKYVIFNSHRNLRLRNLFTINICFHCGENSDCDQLGYDTIQSDRLAPTFRRYLLPPSSGEK
jgi:hypothetical protein